MDSIAVAQAHSRFLSIISEHGMSSQNTYQIDPDLLYHYPMEDMPWAYEAMGKNAKTLELKDIYEDDLYYLLALFTKLRHLSLENINLKDIGQVHSFPPSLESLSLENVKSDKSLLVKLFNYLDDTLHTIDFGSDIPKGLEALHNIKDLRICNKALTKDMSTFWKNNPEIKDVYLGATDDIGGGPKSEARIWAIYEKNKTQIDANFEAMGRLKNLSYLSYTMFFCCPDQVKFSTLKLRLWSSDFDSLNGFLSNVGEELLVLQVNWDGSKCYDHLNLQGFPKLEYLEIDDHYYMEQDAFGDMANLKTLIIAQGDSKDLLEIIEWFPALKEITVGEEDSWDFYEGLEAELEKVLRESGREICINGSEYGIWGTNIKYEYV